MPVVSASRVALAMASLLSITDAFACSPSRTSLIVDEPGGYAAKARIVVRARVDALVTERPDAPIERVDLTVIDGFGPSERQRDRPIRGGVRRTYPRHPG